MYKQICFAFLLVAVFTAAVEAQGGPVVVPNIPCPQYFRYSYDAWGNVEGAIALPYDGSGSLHLQVNASMRGYFGKDRSNMKLSLVTPPADVLQQLTPSVDYKLTFPVQDSIPQITNIVFNNRQYCSGPPMALLRDPYLPPAKSAVTNMYSIHTTYFQAASRSGLSSIEGSTAEPEASD